MHNQITKRRVLEHTMLCLVGVSVLACVGGQGGMQDPSDEQAPARWDVRGNYRLTYDDTLRVTLNIGGVERQATVSGTERIVDLGMHEGKPLVLDLNEYCGRDDVVCPSEALWQEVAIDQKEVAIGYDAHVVNFIELGEQPDGQRAGVIGGFVNHKDAGRFLLGIDGASSQQGDCGALAISLTAGRFEREGERLESFTVFVDPQGKACEPGDGESESCEETQRERLVIPPDTRIIGITEGKVGIGWLGACAFGPVLVGSTLTIETGYTGERIGDFEPPEFVPIVDPDVPDQDVFVDEDMGSPSGMDE